MPYAISHRRHRGVLAAMALIAGCATPVQQYALKDLRLSCDDANRTAYKSLTALGYTVTAFTPAAPGRPGEAKATRAAGTSDGGEKNVTVAITCDATGATVDASENGTLLGQVEFKRAFFLSFTSTQHMDERRQEIEEKVAAGTAPESQQPHGLKVLVEPVRGQAAKLDFDMDMAAADILPVRVRVVNATTRKYDLDPADIQLARRDRTRVPPLPVADAVARLLHARDAAGQPVTTLDQSALTERLNRVQLPKSHLAARGELRGYLYYPLGDYVRARILVTDSDTQEAEGFAVEF